MPKLKEDAQSTPAIKKSLNALRGEANYYNEQDSDCLIMTI